MQKALQYLKRQILVPGFSGVDKGGQGGAQPPPIELKDHPYEKMKFEEKLRGGGDNYVVKSVPILSANYVL